MDQCSPIRRCNTWAWRCRVPKSDGGILTLVSPADRAIPHAGAHETDNRAAGEHNDMILHELGYTEAEISACALRM